jgi:hypothetical protein
MYEPGLCNGRGSDPLQDNPPQHSSSGARAAAAERCHRVRPPAISRRQREYRVACDEHADEREAIRRQLLAEYQAKYGSHIGGSMGGRWAVGHQTLVRFATFMAER